MDKPSGKVEAAAAAAAAVRPGNTEEESGGVAGATVVADVNAEFRAGLPANGDPLDNVGNGGNTGGIPGEEPSPIEERVGLPILLPIEDNPEKPGFKELGKFPGPGGKT